MGKQVCMNDSISLSMNAVIWLGNGLWKGGIRAKLNHVSCYLESGWWNMFWMFCEAVHKGTNEYEIIFMQRNASKCRWERRGAYHVVPCSVGPARGHPGRVLQAPPQQWQLRQCHRQHVEPTVVCCLGQGHEHEDPPRVHRQLQVSQPPSDARLVSAPSELVL